jgi:hypothetical protein
VKLEVVAEDVVSSAVPATEAAYQRKVPVTPPEDALIPTVPGLQTVVPVPARVTEAPTVAVTATRGVVAAHAGDDVVRVT